MAASGWDAVADSETGPSLDFEDTYDGLGNQLDDADDVLNDDTFGESAAEPATQASIGKDFDFFGQTAKVSNVIDEEHLRYDRQHPTSRPPAVDSRDAPKVISKPVRTGYEKYREPGSIPDLKVNASLWGVGAKQAPLEPASLNQEKKADASAKPGSAKKMMSLEEVEAAMRAQRQKRASMQEPPAPAVQPQAPPAEQEVQPRAHARQDQVPIEVLRRPQQNAGHSSLTQMDHPTPMPVQLPAPLLQREPGAPRHPEPNEFNGYRQSLPPQPIQILQNPNRPPAQPPHVAQRSVEEQRQQREQTPGSQIPLPTGILAHRPLQGSQPSQMMHMSEEDRLAFLMEDAKRARRNHKIHLLSKDNGLMTPQDKNFVTRIQLQQLVTATGNPNEQGSDNVLVEDFYYQVHSHIRGGPRTHPQQPLNQFAQTYLFQTGSRHGGGMGRRLQRGGDTHVQRMEQQVQRAVEAAKLKPKNKQLVIEGSLGKISFSNAKTPKPLLNIRRTESNQEANRPQGPARLASERKSQSQVAGAKSHRRDVLRQIEDVYTALMRMEDHERRIPQQADDGGEDELLQPRQAEWSLEMKELGQKLWTGLKVMEPIVTKWVFRV